MLDSKQLCDWLMHFPDCTLKHYLECTSVKRGVSDILDCFVCSLDWLNCVGLMVRPREQYTMSTCVPYDLFLWLGTASSFMKVPCVMFTQLNYLETPTSECNPIIRWLVTMITLSSMVHLLETLDLFWTLWHVINKTLNSLWMISHISGAEVRRSYNYYNKLTLRILTTCLS